MIALPVRRCAVILAAALPLAVGAAMARPVQMVESRPQAEAVLQGDHAEYVVRFDGPVNHYASRMEITQDGRVVHTLHPLQDSAVDVLFAAGPVPPTGRYHLHWTAVSVDGAATAGDIPFSVGRGGQ